MSKTKSPQKASFFINLKVEPTKIQKQVLNFFRSNQISILTGDPGTAKTFLSVYYALSLLRDGAIEKIVLAKPLREVGESMGFLPGSQEEKVAAYLESYISSFDKILGEGGFKSLLAQKKIEFDPVNFVRGNTIEQSFVILDEAQNMTLHEIISYATRLSSTSQMIITGDLLQSDIKKSGFKTFQEIMEGIPGISSKELGDEFQMRSGLVLAMYKAYKKYLCA